MLSQYIYIYIYIGLIIVNGCDDIRVTQSGVYHLLMTPTGDNKDIYCDMIIDDGRWTVINIQRYYVRKVICFKFSIN